MSHQREIVWFIQMLVLLMIQGVENRAAQQAASSESDGYKAIALNFDLIGCCLVLLADAYGLKSKGF